MFLATLGVYFGLVLVGGATPHVYAQAATTREFSVKDEAEVKDDLDTNPDGETAQFSDAIRGYFDDLEELIEDLQKYNRNERFDLNSDLFAFERHSTVSCNEGYDPVISGGFARRVENRKIEKALSSALYDFDEWEIFSDCLRLESGKDHRLYRYNLNLSYDSTELTLEISIPKRDLQATNYTAAGLDQAYSLYEIDDDPVVNEVYKRTRIEPRNNQVLIITRLPRGSLESLLASDDK